jgi:glutaminyl-tRNA synthetase
VIEDQPIGETEWLDAPLWPHDVPREGSRKLPLTRTLFIEADDFAEVPPTGFKRLSPDAKVRLRHAFVVRCTGLTKNEKGEVVEVRCIRDTEPGGGKVKGTIHWVSAEHAVDLPVRLYDRLFSDPHPEAHADKTYEDFLTPGSLQTLVAKAEPALATLAPGSHVQLERQGYFFADPVEGEEGRLILNRTVALRDTWAKQMAAQEAAPVPADGKGEGKKTGPRAPPPLDPEARSLKDAHGLDDEQARTLAAQPELRAFFEAALGTYDAAPSVARWVVNDLAALAKSKGLEALPFGPPALADLARLADGKTITGSAAKDVLAEMAATGESPKEIVGRLGLDAGLDEAALEATVAAVVSAHPDEAARYRAGKKALIGFFVGKVMAATGGKADPNRVREALMAHLEG